MFKIHLHYVNIFQVNKQDTISKYATGLQIVWGTVISKVDAPVPVELEINLEQ